MIAKISTGIYTKGMVMYNAKKTENPQDGKLLLTQNIVGEATSSNIIENIKQRNLLQIRKRETSKPNIHISLSFHKDDILDDKEISTIALDYLNEMGLVDVPLAIYRHFDRQHPHVHIVASQVLINRKLHSDSWRNLKSMTISRKLEVKYNITQAAIGSSTEKLRSNNALQDFNDGHLNLKDALYSIITSSLKEKPKSEKELKRILYHNGVDLIKNEKGFSFAITNREDIDSSRLNPSISGSKIDPIYKSELLIQLINDNAFFAKKHKKNIMGRYYSVINSLNKKPLPLSEVKILMNKKGLKLEENRIQSGSNRGEINGYTITDLDKNIKFKASELQSKVKELAKNIIDDHPKRYIQINTPKPQKPILEPTVSNDTNSMNQFQTGYDKSILDIILEDNTFTPHDLDQQEIKRKKKRRKRGL